MIWWKPKYIVRECHLLLHNASRVGRNPVLRVYSLHAYVLSCLHAYTLTGVHAYMHVRTCLHAYLFTAPQLQATHALLAITAAGENPQPQLETTASFRLRLLQRFGPAKSAIAAIADSDTDGSIAGL